MSTRACTAAGGCCCRAPVNAPRCVLRAKLPADAYSSDDGTAAALLCVEPLPNQPADGTCHGAAGSSVRKEVKTWIVHEVRGCMPSEAHRFARLSLGVFIALHFAATLARTCLEEFRGARSRVMDLRCGHSGTHSSMFCLQLAARWIDRCYAGGHSKLGASVKMGARLQWLACAAITGDGAYNLAVFGGSSPLYGP